MKNRRSINSVIVLYLLGLITSCQPGIKPMKEGTWRGVFILPGNEIPFVFEVKGHSADSTSVFLINGSDRFELKNITYGKDSVSIPIDLYSSVSVSYTHLRAHETDSY